MCALKIIILLTSDILPGGGTILPFSVYITKYILLYVYFKNYRRLME